MQLDIMVLGHLTASVADTSCLPTASKPRQLFALLALNAGHVVSVTEMAEEIWGSDPPRSSTATLHTYIRILRKILDSAYGHDKLSSSKDVLVTRNNGYLLDIEPEQVDAGRYRRLAAAGRRAADSGGHAAASEYLAAALRLWRGPALSDVTIGPRLGSETAWLEESRLSDLELRIDSDLRLGRHQLLLGELAALCVRYPMVESFHAQYMLALFRSGRQQQAMETYQRLWRVLDDQLGVEPTPRLRRLHHAIISGDSALDPSVPTNSWLPVNQAA